MPAIKIELDGDSTGQISIDGHEIAPQTTRFWLSAVPGKTPELKISLEHGLLLEAPNAHIPLATSTRAALVALGWTPPADANDTGEDT